MADEDLSQLIMFLRTHTALGRVNDDEARRVFAKIAEQGYVISKPAAD